MPSQVNCWSQYLGNAFDPAKLSGEIDFVKELQNKWDRFNSRIACKCNVDSINHLPKGSVREQNGSCRVNAGETRFGTSDNCRVYLGSKQQTLAANQRGYRPNNVGPNGRAVQRSILSP